MIMLKDYKDLLEEVADYPAYDRYIEEHLKNVNNAYKWLKYNLPDVLSEDNYIEESAYYGELDDIIEQHDFSKFRKSPDYEYYYELRCEYSAYAEYFYGNEKTPEIKEAFDHAWLSHIHSNPHHWQHWVLINDDDGTHALDIPYVFIIEMICDHWSFSWKTGNLYEIFSWYDKHKDTIIFSDKTRSTYEEILEKIKSKLDSVVHDS